MIEKYLLWVETEIKKQKFGIKPRSLYEPIRYIIRLGGKRIRPLLVLMAYALYKRSIKSITPLAVAVEALHNFTLLHDDVMDGAPLRRGKPTVHEKWNVNTAILSGDIMLAKVYDMLLQMPPNLLKEGLSKFNACITAICEGQQQDMLFESHDRISKLDYIKMVKKKTAALIGFSLEFGAFLAGAPKKDQQTLREIGTDIGIGFQLVDDILDIYANQRDFGKRMGGDIIANKKTFMLVTAIESTRGEERERLLRWLTKENVDKRKKIKAVVNIYDKFGVIDQTRVKADFFFNRALPKLNKIGGYPRKKEELKTFIINLMNRDT